MLLLKRCNFFAMPCGVVFDAVRKLLKLRLVLGSDVVNLGFQTQLFLNVVLIADLGLCVPSSTLPYERFVRRNVGRTR